MKKQRKRFSHNYSWWDESSYNLDTWLLTILGFLLFHFSAHLSCRFHHQEYLSPKEIHPGNLLYASEDIGKLAVNLPNLTDLGSEIENGNRNKTKIKTASCKTETINVIGLMNGCLFKYQTLTEPLTLFDMAPNFLAPAKKIFHLAAFHTLLVIMTVHFLLTFS